MQEYRFSGFVVEPNNFNDIGVLVLDFKEPQIGLCTHLASLGCFALAPIFRKMEDQYIFIKEDVEKALQHIYRYAGKIIIISFDEAIGTTLKVSHNFPYIDAVIAFNPIMHSMHFGKDIRIAPVMRICIDEKISTKNGSYLHVLEKMTSNYKYIQFEENNLHIICDTLASDHEVIVDPLWMEITTVIEFI